jgi:para-nitrobenzyl esterase
MVSARVLKELNIDASHVDDIQKVSYDQLLQAGKRAFAGIREDAKNKGAGTPRLGWGPVKDNYFLPYFMFGPEVLQLCKDVSIMIGTTKTEFAAGASSKTGEDMIATLAFIREAYKEKADAYVGAIKSAYPNTVKASDYLDIDFMFRPGAIRDANKLVSGGHKQTYMYLFEWESPVNDGSLKSMHCMELPFVFNNILLGKEITGRVKEAYDLAETVSGAWINFARKGDPNATGLPHWPTYTSDKGATMIINKVSKVGYHHDKELLEIVASNQK